MLSPNGIRAILFDLDGTLRYDSPSGEHTFFDHAVSLGLDDSQEKRRQAMRWVHQYWAGSPLLLEDRETFKDAVDKFWLNYSRRRLEWFQCPDEQLEELAAVLYTHMREKYKPRDLVLPGVPETLADLKNSGFTLGVISNRTRSYQEQLEKLGLADFFDCLLAAGEVGSYKPEPGIFQHALVRLGVQPVQALYVGDNYYADVIGAQNADITPVLLDPEGVFPDAGCQVIKSFPELIPLLEK